MDPREGGTSSAQGERTVERRGADLSINSFVRNVVRVLEKNRKNKRVSGRRRERKMITGGVAKFEYKEYITMAHKLCEP